MRKNLFQRGFGFFIFLGGCLIVLPLQAAPQVQTPNPDLQYRKTVEDIARSLSRKDEPILEDYTLFYNGEKSRLEGDCEKASRFFGKLIEINPPRVVKISKRRHERRFDSRHYMGALRKYAESLECLQNNVDARYYWGLYYQYSDNSLEKGTALFKMGILDLALGQTEEGVSLLRQFWLEYPENPAVDEARQRLKALDTPPFEATALLERGRLLLERKEYEAAYEVFRRLDHQEAAYWKAETLFRMRRYSEARDLFSQLYKKNEYPAKKQEMFFRMAVASVRLGDNERATANFHSLLEHHPQWSRKEGVVQKLAFIYLDEQKFQEAIPILEKLSRHYGGATQIWAVERLAWTHYRLGNYEESLDEWKHLRRLNQSQKSRYWRARTLEKKGDVEEAILLYQELLEDANLEYYTFLARDHLEALGHEAVLDPDSKVSKKRKKSHRGYKKRKKEIPEDCLFLEKAKELSKLDFPDLVQEELSWARLQCPSEQTLSVPIAKLALKNDYYPIPFYYARSQKPLFKDPLTEWIYPKAFEGIVKPEAARKGLDPYLVYSVMRQESIFNPKALSPVGAQGLMQLMPGTALRLAKKLGWESETVKFDTSSVTRPEVNIKLSLSYLAELGEEFNKEPVYVLASYNAGEEAVRRWRAARPNLDWEEFVEEIPYNETRDYVKKILGYYRTYHLLYD